LSDLTESLCAFGVKKLFGKITDNLYISVSKHNTQNPLLCLQPLTEANGNAISRTPRLKRGVGALHF
jgi:hypothetical protein